MSLQYSTLISYSGPTHSQRYDVTYSHARVPMSILCVVWIALTHNVEWEGLGTMETTKMVVFMSHYTGLALLVLHKRACV
jgi:hypothetical protein